MSNYIIFGHTKHQPYREELHAALSGVPIGPRYLRRRRLSHYPPLLWPGCQDGNQTLTKDALFDGLDFVSEELNGISTDTTGTVRPRYLRTFPGGLGQMIEENGRSRVYLGVRWVKVRASVGPYTSANVPECCQMRWTYMSLLLGPQAGPCDRTSRA